MNQASLQLKGSFRGVPFGLYGHSMESGRRIAVHEFPFRDTPYAEDLGLKARSFTLDLFVNGDDLASRRDALRKALEQKGPGTLVHPYLGTLTVQVGDFTLSESFDAQRLATFSVTFVQAGKLEFPSAAVNPVGTVSKGATASTIHAGTLAANIDISHPKAREAMTGVVQGAVSEIRKSAQLAARPSALPTTDRTEAIGRMASYIRDLSTVVGMLETPDLMSFLLSDLVFRMSSLGMLPLQAFRAYRDLLRSLATLFGALHYPNSLAGLTMAANAALFRDAAYTAVVGSAASSAVDGEFGTLEEATATRAELAEMFDLAMGEVADVTLFGYLQDLRAQSLTQIPRAGEDLPSVIGVRVATPLPSLVLAHDLMTGSPDEARLIELNAARNPWFVPNGSGGKVLILR